MPQAVVDMVVPEPHFDRLPFSADQKSSRVSGLIMLALLVPALLAAMVLLALLAAFGPSAFSIAADNPAAAAQVVVGLAVWTVLFVVPAKRIAQRLGTRRTVRIDAELVTVREVGVLRSRAWTAPLSEFAGVAHHIRSTLSGLRHELVLVHRERGKSVLLLQTPNAVPHATLERAAALLALPQVPAGEL
jgi:Na+/melibiose symporter-like transporter